MTDVRQADPGTAIAPVDERPIPQVDIYDHLSPEQFKERRNTLLRFIKGQLQEADYDQGGKILATNDYYKVPGSEKLALSKKGAELLGDHYRYKIAECITTHVQLDRDFVAARVRVAVHRANLVVGVAERACSSAEAGFQRSYRKYKPGSEGPAQVDWRAAYNDIVARATKRAYVAAIVAACAASDILEVADDFEVQEIAPAEILSIETPGITGPTPKPEAEPEPVSQARVKYFLELLQANTPKVFTNAECISAAKFVNSPRCGASLLEQQIAKAQARLQTAGELPL